MAKAKKKSTKQKMYKPAPGKPKVLIYDIETAPILGYVWRLWDQNIGLNMIEQDWHVIRKI
jgi:hypothetical protein